MQLWSVNFFFSPLQGFYLTKRTILNHKYVGRIRFSKGGSSLKGTEGPNQPSVQNLLPQSSNEEKCLGIVIEIFLPQKLLWPRLSHQHMLNSYAILLYFLSPVLSVTLPEPLMYGSRSTVPSRLACSKGVVPTYTWLPKISAPSLRQRKHNPLLEKASLITFQLCGGFLGCAEQTLMIVRS